MLGEEVNVALSEVRDRLQNFYRYPVRPDNVEVVDRIMKDVEEECVADFKRNSQYNISRIEPVFGGKAENFTTMFTDANIWLIDSSTRLKLHMLPKFEVNAKSFRPFIPQKGNKSDKAYFSLIQSSLNTENKKEEYVKKIIDVKLDDTGMFKDAPEEVQLYSPRLALIYGNIQKANRIVFMLRPSSYRLTRVAYRAYCYVVMCAMVRRISGSSCNLTWSNLDDDDQYLLANSMIVTDSMLATKQEKVIRYPLVHKIIDISRFAITGGELLSAVA